MTLLIAIAGLPGAGKSTLAAGLAKRFGLMRVDRDAIRATMFPGLAPSLARTRAAFRTVLLATEVHLLEGRGCVLDGMTLARRTDRERIAKLAARHGAAHVLLWVDVPPAIAQERLRADHATGRHPAGDRDPALVADVLARFEAPTEADALLDGRGSPETLLHAAAAVVQARLAAAAR